jgi:hypothetical protein
MILKTFAEAIDESNKFSKRHLILGNGFSISCCENIFQYQSLYDEADFSKVENVKEIFKELKTNDFEFVIKSLNEAAKISKIYSADDINNNLSKKLINDAESLKKILVSTIAKNHPINPSAISNDQFWSCRYFLNHFIGDKKGQIYTLNYDLLLYWALMHDDRPFEDEMKLEKNDGFGNEEDGFGEDYVVWQGESSPHSSNIHFLHGALHLFDSGSQIKKFTWSRKNESLINQITDSVNKNIFPIFVAEGSSDQKKTKIRHNAYLYQGLKQFVSNARVVKTCFFILGHSLDDNDDHIFLELGKSGKCEKIYVGIIGDIDSENNKRIIQKAEQIASLRSYKYPLEIDYYDARTANIWGKNDKI